MNVDIVVKFNHLPLVPAQLEQAAAEVTNRALQTVIAIADPLTPVDTGDLKNLKEITMAAPGSQTGIVHWTVDYALYQDKGTVFIAPRLFATTGAEHARPQWVAGMKGVGVALH